MEEQSAGFMTGIYIYIYIYKIVVEGDPKAPFFNRYKTEE